MNRNKFHSDIFPWLTLSIRFSPPLRFLTRALVRMRLTGSADTIMWRAGSQMSRISDHEVIEDEGIRNNPAKVKAIVDIKDPEDIPSLRRFLGMVNQLMKFSPNLAEKTQQLRDLLKNGNSWVLRNDQQEAFLDMKTELTSDRILALYKPERETVVSADASSFGLGAVLLQKQPSGEMHPVAYRKNAECRYAQIEKEALATTWALKRWSNFLIGKKFAVETDHKPLVLCSLFSTLLLCSQLS